MADPNEKKLEKEQKTIKPGGNTKEEGELAEEDLDEVAGGEGSVVIMK